MEDRATAHAHSHDAAPPSSLRGRRTLLVLVLALVAATLAGVVLLRPTAAEVPTAPQDDTPKVKGTVTQLEQVPCQGAVQTEELDAAGYTAETECTSITVRIDEGPDAGQSFTTVGGDDARRVGQGVLLFRNTDPQVPADARYQIADVQRSGSLLVLGAIFLVFILGLGRLRGAMAVVGLATSLVVLVQFLVPALLAGRPPVLTAVVGASAVMLVVLLLAHGPTVRTATAMVGTGSALLLTVLLATVFVERAGLSGLTSDEAAYVDAVFGDIDVRGLLLAGIVIGALGILDDVTVTQVSTVYELRAADPTMPVRRLYAAGLRVGRDHIASTVNTLLLAYAGASMPLLVIVSTSGAGLGETLTNGVVAEEVVRTLVGSIGLIAAVPITTALAAVMCPPVAPAPAVPADEPRARDLPPSRFFDDDAWAARARRGEDGPRP